MPMTTRSAEQLPAACPHSCRSRTGRRLEMSRREFLATASIFGATAATAYGMLGLAAPVRAQTTPQMGGTSASRAFFRR
jgi:peptide/nickel transport system substrate-binding protein